MDIPITELYTMRPAAKLLGISAQALKQNGMSRIQIHGRLIVFTRGLLDWYAPQVRPKNTWFDPYPAFEMERDWVLAHYLTGVQVAQRLGQKPLAIRRNPYLNEQGIRQTISGSEKRHLWRVEAIEYYANHLPKRGVDVADYWAEYWA